MSTTYWDILQELHTRPAVPAADPVWDQLLAYSPRLTIPDAEFYSLVGPEDIRKLSSTNAYMLATKVVERLEGLSKTGIIGKDPIISLQIGNCCRWLNRLFPVSYEGLREGAKSAFWDEETDFSVGKRALNILRRLLHFNGYTMPLESSQQLWYGGIGEVGSFEGADGLVDARKKVVLCILCVLSQQIYDVPRAALDFWTSKADPRTFCSLLNTAFEPTTKLYLYVDTPKLHLTQLSLTLLLVSVTYLPPPGLKNQFRRLLARLNNADEFEWLANSLESRVTPTLWPDAGFPRHYISLFWELVQANKQFRCSPVCVRVAKQLTHLMSRSNSGDESELDRRIGSYALTTLTAENHWCATEIGRDIWECVYQNRVKLGQPDAQLGAVMDVLHNCAPYMVLSAIEVTQFKLVLKALKNADVKEFLVVLGTYLEPQSPGLQLNAPQTTFAPITFVWDDVRLRWYASTLWSVPIKLEPQVWKPTKMAAVKMKASLQTGPALVVARLAEWATGKPNDAKID